MDEKLRRAFQLAYFILGDAAAALRVTREAVATLDVALTSQDKRLYYAPGSRASKPASSSSTTSAAHFRTKVSLSELQLLQRLVYIAAEPEERRAEARELREAAWVVRYLKHLARITLKRNSFFVTLGVSRLLHTYTTPETMQIYELVVQDPARGRDDSYFRRRKAQLMRELQERFGARLAVQRGVRGEERFLARSDAAAFLPLVGECLRTFTPWETRCVVPAAFDARRDELPPLRFNGKDPDAEHAVEAARFHTLLHPDCYGRLLAALLLDAPARRLALPDFHLPDREPPGGDDDAERRRTHAYLSEEEMERIKRELAEERERRRRFAPVWLRTAVDGVAGARTTVAAASLRLDVPPDAEVVEVYGGDGGEERRLAALLLSYDEEGRLLPTSSSLVLEGGQRLSFDVQPKRDAAGECAGATVAVNYRETTLLPTALRRIQARWRTAMGGGANGWWKPALAFTLLAALGAAVAYRLVIKPTAPGSESARNATPTPSALPVASPTSSPIPTPNVMTPPLSPPPASPPISDEVIATDIRARDTGDPADALTRSERSEAVGLLAAKQIYLELSGPANSRQSVARQLRQRLRADGRFNLVADQDEADLALKVSVASAPSNRLALTARLVDANGNVVWPLTPRTNGRKYVGIAEKTIAAFSHDLTGDVRRLEGKRP